jgi:hypothetical protein
MTRNPQGWPDAGSGGRLIDNETPGARQRCGVPRTRLQPWQKGGVDGPPLSAAEGSHMDAIIYLVGLVVIVMAILSFFGLR